MGTKNILGFVSQDKLDLDQGNGIDTSKRLDTVFLRVISGGEHVMLYIYKDLIKERFFISDGNGAPSELSYHVYMEYSDDRSKNNIITQHGYRAKLIGLATLYQPNNNDLISEIQNSDYKEGDLSKIVIKINGSSGMQKQLPSRAGSAFFAGIGANIAVTSFSKGIGLNGATNSSVSPKIDIGADFFINKNVGTLVFRTELYFTTNTVNTSNSKLTDANYTDNEAIKFKQSILSFNPQLIYNFYKTDKAGIYVSGGVTINVNSYSNEHYTVIYNYSGGLQSVQSDSFPSTTAVNFSVTGKVGCVLSKKINLYAGYIPQTRINNDFPYHVYVTSYYMGINYIFDK